MSPEAIWTLALSASRRTGSCAVRSAAGTVREAQAASPAGLPAAVDAVLRELGGRPADVAELLVDLGPGSYTGLRASLAFARVLRRFAGCLVRGCTSLELIAAAAGREGRGRASTLVRPLVGTGRGRCVWGRLRLAEQVELLEGPRCTPLDEALRDLQTHETLLADASISKALPPGVPPAAPVPDYGAIDLLAACLRPRTLDEAEVSPIYSMGSYTDSPRAQRR